MGAAAKLDATYPVIDAQKLQMIRNLGEPDDADGFFKDLVSIFFERVPLLLGELELAVQAEDCLQLERSAHALKGTAGHLGAMWMMKLAEHLEDMGHQKLSLGARDYLDELLVVYPLTRTELETHWL